MRSHEDCACGPPGTEQLGTMMPSAPATGSLPPASTGKEMPPLLLDSTPREAVKEQKFDYPLEAELSDSVIRANQQIRKAEWTPRPHAECAAHKPSGGHFGKAEPGTSAPQAEKTSLAISSSCLALVSRAVLASDARLTWRPPELSGVRDLVVDFLAEGHDYDTVSIERAVYTGNRAFAVGEYVRAMNCFAVAYELFRFLPPDRYLPLAHDLVLRRAVCLSILGRFAQGLQELTIALAAVPYSPAALFFQGILHSKANDTEKANYSFRQCVAQDSDYHDLIDVIVAIFLHMGGYFDHAIETTSKVLRRSEIEGRRAMTDSRIGTLALLVRADSYKFHTDGYFAPQAATDYCTLFRSDNECCRPLAGRGFSFHQHAQIETEFVPRFSDVLEKCRPRGFFEYPCYNLSRNCRVRPLRVACLVLLCCTRFLRRGRFQRELTR
ncbi:unnamed protein product, partial [Amoebophrya sp. A25]|eukprot:GSA25T00016556001.1